MQNDFGCLGIPKRERAPADQLIFMSSGPLASGSQLTLFYATQPSTPGTALGSAVSFVSASNVTGTQIIVNAPGVYGLSVVFSDSNAGATYAIVKNCPVATTTALPGRTNPLTIAQCDQQTANVVRNMAGFDRGYPGDVYTVLGAGSSTPGAGFFRITKLA